MDAPPTTPPDRPGDELLTPPQAGALLQVSAQTMRRWIREDKIAHILLPSGEARIRRSVVETILA